MAFTLKILKPRINIKINHTNITENDINRFISIYTNLLQSDMSVKWVLCYDLCKIVTLKDAMHPLLVHTLKQCSVLTNDRVNAVGIVVNNDVYALALGAIMCIDKSILIPYKINCRNTIVYKFLDKYI